MTLPAPLYPTIKVTALEPTGAKNAITISGTSDGVQAADQGSWITVGPIPMGNLAGMPLGTLLANTDQARASDKINLTGDGWSATAYKLAANAYLLLANPSAPISASTSLSFEVDLAPSTAGGKSGAPGTLDTGLQWGDGPSGSRWSADKRYGTLTLATSTKAPAPKPTDASLAFTTGVKEDQPVDLGQTVTLQWTPKNASLGATVLYGPLPGGATNKTLTALGSGQTGTLAVRATGTAVYTISGTLQPTGGGAGVPFQQSVSVVARSATAQAVVATPGGSQGASAVNSGGDAEASAPIKGTVKTVRGADVPVYWAYWGVRSAWMDDPKSARDATIMEGQTEDDTYFSNESAADSPLVLSKVLKPVTVQLRYSLTDTDPATASPDGSAEMNIEMRSWEECTVGALAEVDAAELRGAAPGRSGSTPLLYVATSGALWRLAAGAQGWSGAGCTKVFTPAAGATVQGVTELSDGRVAVLVEAAAGAQLVVVDDKTPGTPIDLKLTGGGPYLLLSQNLDVYVKSQAAEVVALGETGVRVSVGDADPKPTATNALHYFCGRSCAVVDTMIYGGPKRFSTNGAASGTSWVDTELRRAMPVTGDDTGKLAHPEHLSLPSLDAAPWGKNPFITPMVSIADLLLWPPASGSKDGETVILNVQTGTFETRRLGDGSDLQVDADSWLVGRPADDATPSDAAPRLWRLGKDAAGKVQCHTMTIGSLSELHSGWVAGNTWISDVGGQSFTPTPQIQTFTPSMTQTVAIIGMAQDHSSTVYLIPWIWNPTLDPNQGISVAAGAVDGAHSEAPITFDSATWVPAPAYTHTEKGSPDKGGLTHGNGGVRNSGTPVISYSRAAPDLHLQAGELASSLKVWWIYMPTNDSGTDSGPTIRVGPNPAGGVQPGSKTTWTFELSNGDEIDTRHGVIWGSIVVDLDWSVAQLPD